MNRVSLSQATPSDLLSEWRQAVVNRFGADAEADPKLQALLNLLDAMDWHGSGRRILEALPAHEGPFSLEDIRNTLVRLGLRTIPYRMKPRRLSESLCPCLFIGGSNKEPQVITGRDEKGFRRAAANQIGIEESVLSLPSGTFYLIEPIKHSTNSGAETARNWVRSLFQEFRSVIIGAFVIAFLINLLSLIGPLSIMVIYDQVIAKESLETLDWLIVGVGIAVAFEFLLRLLRARSQAYIGAKLDYQVGSKVFEQVLHLPPLFTERAPVGGQVTRIREFDSFREIFSGPLAGIALDLPFTLLFVLVLFWIGGPLALIPVVLALVYLVLARLVMPSLRDRTKTSGRARSDRYAFLVELMWGMRSIKQQDGAPIWKRRFRTLSADASWANFDVNRLHSGCMALAQTIMFVSGVATLAFGVMLVHEGAMSLGALIATMMLVWRVLGPIQTLFSLANRVEQIQQSLKQLGDMLSYRREQEPGRGPAVPIQFNGQMQFNRVSMRYSHDSNPALLGVSFSVNPGELIGIAGESGSGKSTLAKLALGLYQPQGGSVVLDGIDLRQLRPITLRQTLGYVPQKNHAFPGSLYDNIRLANPTASIDEIRHACKMAGVLHKIEALPHGFDTTFKDGLHAHVPQGFLRQLALARAFLTDAPVYILDEPTSSMDEEDERYFLRALEVLRDRKTVLMVTQRPSHMLLCDRLIYLEKGQLRYFDEPERVLDAVHAASLDEQKAIAGRGSKNAAALPAR